MGVGLILLELVDIFLADMQARHFASVEPHLYVAVEVGVDDEVGHLCLHSA